MNSVSTPRSAPGSSKWGWPWWSTRYLPALLGIAFALLAWWTTAHFGLIGRTLIASPIEVTRILASTSEGANVWLHALHTFKRAVQGWAVALALGTTVGLIIGRARALYTGSEPLIEFVRAVPPVIIFPLLLALLNNSITSYGWTIVLGCTPVMVLAVARRLQQISEARIELLRLYRVPAPLKWAAMSMEILPGLFLGARVTLSIAVVISVVTEMVIAPDTRWALGAMAKDALMAFETPKYYAAVVAIGTFGYVSNLTLRLLEGWIGFGASVKRQASSGAR